MARLFGKEFHEQSNTWYFKNIIQKFQKDELVFKKYLDEESNIVFKFEAVPSKKHRFPVQIIIKYSKTRNEILNYHCSEDGNDNCKHYLSVLNYAYHFLTTDILEKEVIQTYQTKLLSYNEFWQMVVINAKIEIGDIFSQQTDKIRFHLSSYKPMRIRLVSLLAAGKEYKEEDIAYLDQSQKQMKSLSAEELELFKLLQRYKCSFSRRGCFFTIYKDRFVHFLPILRNLKHKLYIQETGDRIEFPDEEFRINFQVYKYNRGQYNLRISSGEQISAAFIGITSYFFRKNKVFSLNLPFNDDIARQIFAEGYHLKKTDLVYLSSVVSRQLGIIKCYIDISEEIILPKVYHNFPIVTFKFHKEGKKLIMLGLLDYGNDLLIPMSVIRFPTELVRYDQNNEECWFYIAPQLKYQILEFAEKLPDSRVNKLETESKLVFSDEKNIEQLKKTIFEHTDPSWNIILTEELKKEFVYKVTLEPVIKARKSVEIEWFEYEVQYNYKDISFSHKEMKKFFQSKEKFMKLEDGRLLFFENIPAFQKVEEILKKSQSLKSESYKLSIYNLPYIYQLENINTGIKVFGDQFLEEMFSAILNRRLPKFSTVPLSLQPVMRSYQKAGYHWLKMLRHYRLGGILADDMGLGKTVQALSILSDLPDNSISLVVCPKTLLFNWGVEIEKFSRDLSYVIYEGNQKERRKILRNINVNVILASYSIVLNDIDLLKEIRFTYMILDEAQHIKNKTALRTKAVKRMQSDYKICLSGTPIENHPAELWSIFDFLMPGYLPPLRQFKDEFNTNNLGKIQDKLKAQVSPFILRRKKRDVLIELPDKQMQITYCKLSSLQEKMYLQILDKIKRNYLGNPDGLGKYYIHVLAALTKLRQVCNHPALVDKDIKSDYEFSGKIELLQEIIGDAVASGKKLLIFSQFVEMLKMLKSMLIKMKISFEYLDGNTKDRRKCIDNFNTNINIKAFLISLKTGGFGINLTAADTVILVDPWWNPMGEDQAVDRAHRIGQTKKVNVYKIITRGTIEEKILQLQQNKREMFESLIDGGQNFMKRLTKDQLQELLEY